jgi:hypothetical protein
MNPYIPVPIPQAPEVETRSDTERLDWLIKSGYHMDTAWNDKSKFMVMDCSYCEGGSIGQAFTSAREAIDAAMDVEVQGEVKNG